MQNSQADFLMTKKETKESQDFDPAVQFEALAHPTLACPFQLKSV